MPEAGLSSTGGAAAQIPISKYERLIATAKRVPSAKAVVVHPSDETSLRGAVEAAQLGLIEPLLVGPVAKIRVVARECKIDIAKFELMDAPHSHAAAAKAVELIRAGQGELLMKGSLHTDELMREVTASSTGLRTERRISHVFVMDVPTYAETLFLTDAAVNIFPDLDAKRDPFSDINAYSGRLATTSGVPRFARPKQSGQWIDRISSVVMHYRHKRAGDKCGSVQAFICKHS